MGPAPGSCCLCSIARVAGGVSSWDRQAASRGEGFGAKKKPGWLALVAALVVLALSGCQTGASSNHPGTSKAAAPSSTAHAAVVQPASKIAFINNRTGTYNVYVVNADGGGLRQLTRFRSGDVGRPALSPDGKSVVFDRAKTADGDFDIWIVRSDGHGLRDLTPGPRDDTAPSWSPDGAKVLFASDRGGAYDIFVMKASGTGMVQLSDRGRGDLEPAFSRDGKRIAFVECDQSFHCQLWAMNANGKGARRLTKTPVEAERPSWSLNDTKLAVTVKRAGNIDVAVVAVRGGALQRLTHDAADDFQPSYSPDGTRIAFGSNRAGAPSLYVMQADGTQVSSLTSPNKGQDEAPHWQPPR
jgi:Tol biopolymer transport system component